MKNKTLYKSKILLAYPDFSQRFDIHTNSSDYQLGSVISQNNKPITFYSQILTSAQENTQL